MNMHSCSSFSYLNIGTCSSYDLITDKFCLRKKDAEMGMHA